MPRKPFAMTDAAAAAILRTHRNLPLRPKTDGETGDNCKLS